MSQEWKWVVYGRVITRTDEGPILRGFRIDRTSMPGSYTISATTKLWFSIIDQMQISLDFEFDGRRYFCGAPQAIADEVAQFVESNDAVRRVVGADPGDPVYVSPNSSFGGVIPPGLRPRFFYAVMRALEGETDWALNELRVLRPELDNDRRHVSWPRMAGWFAGLIGCLEKGGDVRQVIEPWTAASKATVQITPVKHRAALRQARGAERPA